MSFSEYWRGLESGERGPMEWEFIHWMFIAGKWDLQRRNSALDNYYENNTGLTI